MSGSYPDVNAASVAEAAAAIAAAMGVPAPAVVEDDSTDDPDE